MMLARPKPEETHEEKLPSALPAAPPTKMGNLEQRLANLGGDADGASTKPAPAGRSALLERVKAAQERARAAQQKHKEEQEKQQREKEEKQQPPPPAYESVEAKESAPPSYADLLDVESKPAEPELIPEVDEEEENRFLEELEKDTNVVTDLGGDGAVIAHDETAPQEDVLEIMAPSAPPLHAQEEEEEDFSSLYQTTSTAATSGATLEGSEATKMDISQQNPYSLEDLPPSYEEFAVGQPKEAPAEDAGDAADAFEYDAFGNIITSEERKRVQEEQKAILEQIKRQQQEAAAADAAAREAAAAPDTSGAITESQDTTDSPAPATAAARSRGAPQIVQIGPGHRVAVHDQTKTRDAIKTGTALLVECVSCQNWMQIADSASLMFCPCCQSVVPIVKQNAVKTKEEAIRITRDRRMAQQMQNSEWGEEETKTEGADSSLTFGSWKEFVTSFFTKADEGEGVTTAVNSAEVVVSPREMSRDERGEDGDNETEGLLPPARVAERQPHFLSCVVESVSSVASSIGRTLQTSEEEEGNETTIDDMPLLAVTQAGRGHDGDGNNAEYRSLLDQDSRA